MPGRRFIGLMSGTSLDGVDGVLVEFTGDAPVVLQHAAAGFEPPLRAELLALNLPGGSDELHRAALAANALARVYARVVRALLEASGSGAADVAAIGAHGQTVRHRPREFDGTGYTLQLDNPALLAELTGIRVIGDFRSRDVAAGGQGAPLVPAFHRTLFARPGRTVAVLNIGGISNLSVLGRDGSVIGFDCGPGNALLDHWCERHTGAPFDAEGRWGSSGLVDPALLARLLDEPYFARTAPKSTGRDLFNAAWLAARLEARPAPADVQATLVELTASAISDSVLRYGKDSEVLIVCGGGALNAQLLRRLAARLPAIRVESSAAHGLPPLQVEATAFAWLAKLAVDLQPVPLATVTGARGDRVLGASYPA